MLPRFHVFQLWLGTSVPQRLAAGLGKSANAKRGASPNQVVQVMAATPKLQVAAGVPSSGASTASAPPQSPRQREPRASWNHQRSRSLTAASPSGVDVAGPASVSGASAGDCNADDSCAPWKHGLAGSRPSVGSDSSSIAAGRSCSQNSDMMDSASHSSHSGVAYKPPVVSAAATAAGCSSGRPPLAPRVAKPPTATDASGGSGVGDDRQWAGEDEAVVRVHSIDDMGLDDWEPIGHESEDVKRGPTCVGHPPVSAAQPQPTLAEDASDPLRQPHLLRRWRLRQCEVVILSEFVEVMVPTQYLCFMAFGYYGYNRQSFLSFNGMTEEDFLSASQWVGTLLGVELVGFAVLMAALHRLLGWNPVRQLAFVVKRHWWLLGSIVALCMAFTIALIVAQNGCDFSFEFAWV